MKKMLYILLFIMLAVSVSDASDNAVQNELDVTIRIIPYAKYCFHCRGSNFTDEEIILRDASTLLVNRNSIYYYRLDDAEYNVHVLGALVSYPRDDPPPLLSIGPSQSYMVNLKMMHMKNFRGMFGRYVEVYWSFGNAVSNSLYVGFPDENGELAAPVLPSSEQTKKEDKLRLAYIFKNNGPGELAFLFVNMGEKPQVVMEGKKCQIVVSSPSLKESFRITLEGENFAEKVIEPGDIFTARIDWPKVLASIPAERLEEIINGGGDVDLVWKEGDVESMPLLMNLLPPEKHMNSKLVPKASDDKPKILLIQDE